MSMLASPLLLEQSTATAILAYPVPSHQGRRATVEWQWRWTVTAAPATAPRVSNSFPSWSVHVLAPSTGIGPLVKNKKRKKKQPTKKIKLHATNNDDDFLRGCCCCFPRVLSPLQPSSIAATSVATISIPVGSRRRRGSIRKSGSSPSSLFSFHGKSIRGGSQEVRFSRSDRPSSRDDEGSSPTITTRTGETGTGEEAKKLSSSSSSSQTAFPTYGDGDRSSDLGNLSLLQTRRFWLGASVGASVVLGGNLGGVTSSILNLRPQAARTIRADVIFPVKGFKRCLDSSQGFEFIYPTSWVGDQRLLYRAVERAERERSLEPLPPVAGRRPSPPQRGGAGAGGGATSRDPVVAFGPPGTAGELNVSVVVAPVSSGFSLQKIGEPREAGERILKQFIAPEGSKRAATLLNAEQRVSWDRLYYTLEYTVQGPGFFRHNLAVYATNAGVLYSLNAQTSESDWNEVKSDFFEIANSFKLVV